MKFLVETIEIVKKQYLVDATDAVDASDSVVMKEVRYYDKCSVDENIISVREMNVDAEGCYNIPNVDPIRDIKIQSQKQ